MGLFDKFEKNAALYNQLSAIGKNPFTVVMEEVLGPTRAKIKGRETVLAGTHNYLGQTFERSAIEAAKQALDHEGTGTTGSRVANGTFSGHTKLESDLANFLGMDQCIVFSTGYAANLGAIAGFVDRVQDVVLIDADCHACIYDGCQLSGAETIRFRHNDPENLDKRLSRLDPKYNGKLVCIEGMYSMYGDVAPVKEFVEVAHKHGAHLLVDEAHSFGVYGETGKGVCEADGVMDSVDFYTGTFSKSLAAIGGFLASNHPEAEYLRFSSNPYRFTASPSPATIASANAALANISENPVFREKLWENANRLHAALTQFGLRLAAKPGPVISVLLPTKEDAFAAWDFLLEHGVYVNMAIPPGTPGKESLLRLAVSSAHSADDIDRLVSAYEAMAEAFPSARVTSDA
ncbi:aminotransferase class I/II-fold pyridoxal phosphate-dependent enzyme [Hyphococcus flavus]|uniref:Aminotransferase class I/II-fold pyridoxal phosphate-dependent enzyme n=1 Tax=Hyphococcus flavus TaxID=1866326 RepID=A0AAE9ZF94_9PROT|nr:aminotransferase class I/II-fold pyridoxal phosphate-dependent enzyme [Hyphococcus flavus]WDI32705.1 aminotransferase class I/II-fold pyridoxal phosphate-dependent enzyme [Hyphococcus flavus]